MHRTEFRFRRSLTALTLLGVMLLSTCSVNQVGLGAKVDITPPKVKILTPAENGQYIKGPLVLSGSASDDLGLKTITITYPSAAGPDVVSKLAVSAKTWSITLPVGTPEGLPEGKVNITASATDDSGKTTTDTVLVYIDNLAPTVLVTAPLTYALAAADAPQFTDSIDIKGEVYDPSPVPSGSVEVRLLRADGTPVPSSSRADGWTTADGSNTFSVRFLLKDALLKESDDKAGFYYEVRAADQAGNQNSYYYHRNDIYDVLPANTIFPAMNELGQIDQAAKGESSVSFIPFTAEASSKGVSKGLADIQMKVGGGRLGNFQYSAISKPKIKFSNFDQSKLQQDNALAPGSVVNGTITPDANGGAIDPKSVVIEFWTPNAVRGERLVTVMDTDNTSLSDNIELLGFGDSLVFTVNLKNGDKNLAPGPYAIKVTATAKGSNPQSVTGDFMVDDSAPVLVETAIGTGALTMQNKPFILQGTAKAGAALNRLDLYQAKDPQSINESTDTPVQTISLSDKPANVENTWTSSAFPAPLGDGTYYYLAKLISASGKSSSVYRTILFDSTPPVIDVSSPGANSWVSNGALLAKGTADDGNGTGVAQVRVLVDAASVDHSADTPATIASSWGLATGTVSWSYSIASLGSEGRKKLWVASQDKAGNWTTTQKIVAFGLDTAAPTLTPDAATLALNGTYVSSPPTVAGTATDTNGIKSLEYSMDGGMTYATLTDTPATITDATPVAWTKSLALTPNQGAKQVILRATDQSDKQQVHTFTISYDNLPPELSVLNLDLPPTHNALVTNTFEVKGTVSDPSGIATLEYSLNGGAFTAVSAGPITLAWSKSMADLIGGADGTTGTLVFRATDRAGNSALTPSSGAFQFGVDLNNPTLTSNSSALAGSNQTGTPPLELSGTASDASGLKSLEYSLDGGVAWTAISVATLPSWTATIPIDSNGSTDGLKSLRIRATDIYDKTTTHSASFRIDASAPTLTLTNLTNGQLISSLPFTFRGTVSDNGGSGVSAVEYSLDEGATWTAATTTGANWEATPPLTEALAKVIQFRARDMAGNVTANVVGATSFTVNVDTAAPTISGVTIPTGLQTAPFALSFLLQDSLALSSFTVTQERLNETIPGLQGPKSIPTTANGVTGQVTSFSGDVSQFTLETFPRDPGNLANHFATPDGEYEYVITVNDAAGRPAVTYTARVTIDTAPPVKPTFTTVPGNTMNSLSVAGTSSDAGSGIAAAYYRIDGNMGDPATGTLSGTNDWFATLDVTAQPQGNHTISVWTVDRAGNSSAEESKPFTKDLDNPTLTGVPTLPLYTNAGFQLTGTAADSWGVASVVVTQKRNGGSAETLPDTLATGAWTLNNLPRDPASLATQFTPLDGAADGFYEYQITVTDLAGKTTVETRSVRFDATAPSVSVSSPSDGSVVSSTSFAFSGTAADGTGSGLQNVEYATTYSDDGNDANDTWVTANGSSSWGFNVGNLAATFGAEGTKIIGVRAKDNAGNTSASAPRSFIFDTAVPVVTVSGTATRDTKVAFTLSGSASDNYGIKSLTVTQQKTGDPNGVVTISSSPATLSGPATNQTWTLGDVVSLPRDPSDIGTPLFADGTYIYDVSATDLADKTSLVATVTVRIDQTAPEDLDIVDPASGLIGVNSLTGKTNLFRGIVGDAGVGTAKIWYAITTNATPPAIDPYPAAPVGYTAVLSGNGNWSFTDTNRAEGSYYLHVIAEDKAGNRSASAKSQAFDIDVAAPALTESVMGSPVYNTKAGYSISGTWVESHGVASFTVTQAKDGGAAVPLTSDFVSTSAWSLTGLPRDPANQAATLEDDGLYEYVFHITDLAGKSSTMTRTVRLDKTGPSLSILNPSDDLSWANTTNFAVTGSATDLTSVRAVFYHLGASDGGTPTNPALDADWASAGWTKATGTTNWTAGLTGLSQGANQKLWIRAVDAAGNMSTSQARLFGVDTAKPTLSGVSTPPANTNAGYQISGTASDTVGVASVIVTQTRNGGSVVTLPDALVTTGTVSEFWTLGSLPRDPALPAVQLTLDDGANGVYDYQITVTDLAGKTEILSRSVRFDKSAPTVVIEGPAANGSVVSSTSFAFSGTTTDTGSSGVASVEYAVGYSNDGNDGNDSWLPAVGSSSWSFNVADLAATFGAEGPKTLGVRATDNAGNTSAGVMRSFIFDTAVPVVSITGAATRDTKTAFTLSGTASDNYGVDTLSVKQNGVTILTNPIVGTTTWTLANLPREGLGLGSAQATLTDGSYTYDVTATDLAGKTSLVASVTVRIDQTAPETLSIVDPAAGLTGVNSLTGKTNLFRGSVSDAGVGAGKVWYAITSSATPPTVLTTPAAAGYSSITSGNGNWSFTDSNRAEGSYYLHVLAEDTAGNLTDGSDPNHHRPFDIDVAPPLLTETTVGNAVLDTKLGYSISGTWTETQGVATFTVTQSKDGGAAVPITTGFTTTSPWSLSALPRDPANQASTLENDGLYEYVFTITDLAGKTSSITRTVRLDKTGPSLSVLNPSDDLSWANTTNFTVTGSATDLTSVRAVFYHLGASDGPTPANPKLDLDWVSSGQWIKATGSTNWTVSLVGLSQGANQKLWIRAVDASGNMSASEVRGFGVDTAKPSLTGVSTPAVNTNTSFQLTGTASDAVGVASVVVTQTRNSGSVVTLPDSLVTSGTLSQVWTLANLPRDPGSPADPLPLDATSNGVYDYQIIVTDLAGKTETVSRSVRFDRSAPAVTITGPGSNGTVVSSSAYAFNGIASDGGASGVATVEYASTYSNDGNDSNDTWVAAVGGSSWSVSIADLAADFGSEGPKVIGVRATDNAGNTSASVARTFVFDTANPVVTIAGAATRDTKAAFSLSGSANDNYGLASISVKQNGVTISTNGAVGTGSWTLSNLPREGSGLGSPQATLTDGTYTYDVTATDLAGKTSLVASVTVRIDQTAPETLSIVDPAAGLTGVNSLTGKTNLFRGSVSDAGVGAGKVWYAITSSATPPTVLTTPAAAGYSSITSGNGNWSFTDSNRAEGSYYLHVLAEDTAGNLTDGSSPSHHRPFDIDVATPVITESSIGTTILNTKIGFSIAGTWTETHGVASFTVTQKKDGGAPVPLTSNFTTSTNWSLTGLPRNPADESQTALSDGLYEYVFTITDLAGKTSSITRTVRFDATVPVVTITSPSENAWTKDDFITIAGVSTDGGGSGITAVQYSPDGTNYSPVSGSLSSWNVPLTGLGEGALKYYFRATDATGNTSTPIELNFGVDKNLPAVPTETMNPSLTLSKVAFDLGGALADSNALKAVSVTQRKDSEEDPVELLNAVKTGTSGTWTVTGLPRDPNAPADTLVADGSYEYVVTVTDAAGKTRTLTRTVRIDTTAPSVTIEDPGLYLSGNSGSLFGTADDGTGSGIDKVQYSLVSATGPWTNATGKNNWLVALNLDTDGPGVDTGLAEGSYTLYIQALDKAGNATGTPESKTFQVDQAAPSLALFKVDGADFTADTIYGNAALALSGTALDSHGVASVTVTQFKSGGTLDTLSVTPNPGTTSRTWSTSADLGQGEGTYTLTVTITDAVGRTTSIQKTVIKDASAPGLPLVTTPASANQWLSGASFNFSGTAADVGTAGVGAVYFAAGSRGLTPPSDLTDSFWTLASGTTSWTASVDLTGEGERSLYLKAVDRAGNISALQTFNFGIDQGSPTLSFTGPTGAYFNGNFTLTGTASDTNALTSVTVAEKRPGDVMYRTPETATGTTSWSLFKPMNAMDGLPPGVYEYRITVTDVAGKQVSYDKSLTRDMTSPAVTLNAPLPTIGGPVTYQGNGTLTLSGVISDLNGLDALEMQVGSGSWVALGTAPFTSFNTTLDTVALTLAGTLTEDATATVTIRATDKAGNQGTSAYSILVDQDSDKPVVTITGPTASENIQSANIGMAGTIVDDDGVNTTGVEYRLSYNGGSTWTSWTAIPSGNVSGSATSRSFNYTTNDPSNGSKILQIRATDSGNVVGNAASVVFTQDTGAPVMSSLSPTEGSVTNAATFVVSGTATDSASVASVTYRVLRDGVEIVATTPTSLGADSDAGVGEIRTFTSPAISTAAGSGNYQVQLVSSDGTNTRQETINIVVDKTAPSVSFTSPSAASVQNNVITLTGIASDNRLLSSVAVEIWKGGVKVADVPGMVSGTSNWSLSFDTAVYGVPAYATFVSGSAYNVTLRAVATDSIGNTGSSADLTFQVDQATDSPGIAISTAQSPVYLSAFSVNGTANDDDGITQIEVSSDGSTWNTLTAPGGGWTKNSSWNTTLAAGDGAKTLYVRVTDSSTPAIVTTSSAFTFRVDTEAPDGAFTTPAVNSRLKASELTFTGTYGDESGVTSVKLKVDNTDFSSGAKNANPVAGTWSYTFSQADLVDGPRTIYLEVTDSSGRTSTSSRTVFVDTTAPVVTVTEPANASSAFGLVRLRGSALDATSGVKNIKIGLGKTINTANWENALNTWYPATGTVSWEYVITNINNYASTTYATDLGDTNANGVVDGGETWQNIWRMYLYVRAEDTAGLASAGNVSVVDTYYLEVDPLKDRPEITVLQPVATTSTVGGFLRIVGSSYDTNYIAKNQIAFDMDNNGSFKDAGDTWPSVAPAVDQTDSGTTAWYAMTGTTSWSTVINNAGEFNPTGGNTTRTIKFKVRSVDSKVAHGGTPSLAGLESVYTVTFSNQIPQYSAVSLATGDTIGGTVVLTAFVKVPTAVGMKQIWFNHEGPRLEQTDLIGGAAGMRAVLLTAGHPNYETGYDKYAIEATINTSDPDLFPNNAGSMSVSLWAEDNSDKKSIQTINLTVDNKAPTGTNFTNLTEIAGTAALVQGTATDTGVVSGIKRVVFYLQKGSSVYRLKGTSIATAPITGDPLPNGSSQVLDLGNTAYNDYRIVIDKTTEGGNDIGAGGDNDGFNESLSSSFGTYTWNAAFNSTLTADGSYDAKFTAYDVGNNSTSQSQATVVANNKPVITSIVLATDLNGDGDVADPGEASSNISTNYATTGFTGRGNRLGVTINTTGGNNTKRYSVKYLGVEQNATLTSNTLIINTSGIADSATANDRVFTILVYDSTTSDDTDPTGELTSQVVFGVTIDNVDTVPPTVQIAPFGQKYSVGDNDASKTLGPVGTYSENIKMSGQTPLGHVEYAADSLNNGTDADLSGEVIFKGKVSDNQKVNRITATIPGFNGGAGVGTEFNLYTFAGGALSGTGWSFAADGTNFLTEANGNVFNWNFTWNSSLISTVAANNVLVTIKVYDANGTPNSATNTMTVDVVPYIRAISGRLASAYPSVPTAFTRSAKGAYSVAAGEVLTVTGFNLSTAANSVSINGVTKTPTGGSSTSLTVNVGTNTTSGAITVTTNAVVSTNNINNDALAYNQEPNGLNNNTLSDNRTLWIWDFASHVNSVQLSNPVLRMDSASNWYMSYGQGSTMMYFNKNGTETKVEESYNRFHNTIVGFDTSGNWYGGASNTDRISDLVGGASSFTLYSRQAGDQVNGAGAHYANGTNKRHLELSYNGATGVYDINRVKIPKMVVKGAGTAGNPAALYMVYYDANSTNKALKFRYGTSTAADTLTGGFANNLANNNPGSSTGFQTMATSASTYPGGLYAAVDATSTGVAVAAWYDSTNRRLIYSYNTNPAGATEASWQTNAVVIDSNFAGWWVDMTVDANNGVHIAYYSSGSGDLKYAYLSTYNGTPQVVTVDSFLSTGTQIQINTRLESGNYVPYISYFQPSFVSTSSSVKVAWRTNFTSLLPGAENDLFTGNWEIMTLPTANVPVDGFVNSGVPTSGTYANSVFLSYYTDAYYERAYRK